MRDMHADTDSVTSELSIVPNSLHTLMFEHDTCDADNTPDAEPTTYQIESATVVVISQSYVQTHIRLRALPAGPVRVCTPEAFIEAHDMARVCGA